MDAESLTNILPWILAATVFAFIVGDLGDFVPTAMVIILILQITASMAGIKFRMDIIKRDAKRVLYCIICCFGVSSGISLLCGYLFPSDDIGIFYGWVMIAAVPCAVSCVTVALTMYGDRVLSVVSLAAIYVVALFLTPLITTVFIGDAISPLEILKYIILFVAVPLGATVVLNRFNIPRVPKAVFINLMMFLLVMLSIGRNSEFILSDLGIVAWILVFAFIRCFVVGGFLFWLFRRMRTDRGAAIDYVSLCVWKNTGLATSMCLVLLPTMPQSAVPCAVCLLVESLWYAVSNNAVNRMWPPEAENTA